MGVFVKSDIVVMPYPFSSLKSKKKRPVLVLKNSSLNDLIVIPFTSKVDDRDKLLYKIDKDMIVGKEFAKESSLILDKIFTLSSDLVLYKFGELKPEIYEEILKEITKYLNESK